MIVTPRIFLRLALIVVLAVLLQLSFFSRVAFVDTSPDILPAVAICFGLLGGSMSGAVAGFSLGFLSDCLLVEALGASSLVLLGTGYLAGLFRERFEIHSALVPPLLCMGLTFFAELCKRDSISAKALAFTILTAARSGEVRGATLGEIKGTVAR